MNSSSIAELLDLHALRKYYTSPSASYGGCCEEQQSRALTWTGSKTPPPGKTMAYTVALPYFDDIDLGKLCHQMHPSLPQKSCVIGIDRTIDGKKVLSAFISSFSRV
jgi:hypothetical protein